APTKGDSFDVDESTGGRTDDPAAAEAGDAAVNEEGSVRVGNCPSLGASKRDTASDTAKEGKNSEGSTRGDASDAGATGDVVAASSSGSAKPDLRISDKNMFNLTPPGGTADALLKADRAKHGKIRQRLLRKLHIREITNKNFEGEFELMAYTAKKAKYCFISGLSAGFQNSQGWLPLSEMSGDIQNYRQLRDNLNNTGCKMLQLSVCFTDRWLQFPDTKATLDTTPTSKRTQQAKHGDATTNEVVADDQNQKSFSTSTSTSSSSGATNSSSTGASKNQSASGSANSTSNLKSSSGGLEQGASGNSLEQSISTAAGSASPEKQPPAASILEAEKEKDDVDESAYPLVWQMLFHFDWNSDLRDKTEVNDLFHVAQDIKTTHEVNAG
ncbi:unnamed protein product, partial [Amoebophrya sp. A25]